jgi:hypothetical protein
VDYKQKVTVCFHEISAIYFSCQQKDFLLQLQKYSTWFTGDASLNPFLITSASYGFLCHVPVSSAYGETRLLTLSGNGNSSHQETAQRTGGSIGLGGWQHRQPKIHRQKIWVRAASRIFLPILFPIGQRWHRDFCVFRIRPMHRLGSVAQRLLREPLQETAFQRPLRPRIPA